MLGVSGVSGGVVGGVGGVGGVVPVVGGVISGWKVLAKTPPKSAFALVNFVQIWVFSVLALGTALMAAYNLAFPVSVRLITNCVALVPSPMAAF